MVCTGKNIANGSKNPKFPSYHVRAVPALCARSRSGSSIGPLLFPVAQFLMSVLCKLDTCSPMLCQWFVQYYKETTHLRVPLGCKFAICVPCDVPNGLACKFSIASHDFGNLTPAAAGLRLTLPEPRSWTSQFSRLLLHQLFAQLFCSSLHLTWPICCTAVAVNHAWLVKILRGGREALGAPANLGVGRCGEGLRGPHTFFLNTNA